MMKIRVGEQPTQRFNILTVGETGLGKSSFIMALLGKYLSAKMNKLEWHEVNPGGATPGGVTFTTAGSFVLESESTDQSVQISIFNAKGYGDLIDNSAAVPSVRDFLVDKHRRWLSVKGQYLDTASLHSLDDRIHLCFQFMSPHNLKELDVHFLETCGQLVPIVPVIAKADCLTAEEQKAQVHLVEAHIAAIRSDLGRSPIYEFEPACRVNPADHALCGTEGETAAPLTPSGRSPLGIELEFVDEGDFSPEISPVGVDVTTHSVQYLAATPTDSSSEILTGGSECEAGPGGGGLTTLGRNVFATTSRGNGDFHRLRYLLFEDSRHLMLMTRLAQECSAGVYRTTPFGFAERVSRHLLSLGDVVPALITGGLVLESFILFKFAATAFTSRPCRN